MTPVALVVGGLGFALVYSALTGQPFLQTLRETFTSPANSRVRPESKPILGAGLAVGEPWEKNPPNSNGSGGAASDGGGTGGGAGGFGARITAAPTTSTGGNPCRALPVPATLVKIGQSGHSLAPAAAASHARASKAAGGFISVTDSFRSYDQQADCHRRKPTLCAAPGGSCHEKGLAIDVVDMKNQRIIDALTAEGWVRFDPAREPWHWSFQVRG